MYIEQLRPARKIFFKGDLGHPTVQYMILFTLCTLLYCMAVCTVHDLVYLVYVIVLLGSMYCTWYFLPCVRYCTTWQSVQYMILFTLCTLLYCLAVCTVRDLIYLVYGIVLHGSLYSTWSCLPCVRYCTAWQSVLLPWRNQGVRLQIHLRHLL